MPHRGLHARHILPLNFIIRNDNKNKVYILPDEKLIINYIYMVIRVIITNLDERKRYNRIFNRII